jgi:ligand-binding sensor domain-containing protein
VFDGTSYTSYTTANGLGDDVIRNIKEAPNGDVWIATINGATRFSASSFTAFGSPNIPFGGTTYIAFAGNGDVLLGGGLGGMIVYNGSTFSTVTTAGGLLSNRIRSIALNDAEQRWIATADGISVLDASNTHITDHENVFILPPPDELNPITDILVDDFGRVWAGVYVDYLVTEGGISMYDGTQWTQWETSDGLAGPNVTRIAMDEDGNLWIATSTGLTRMSGINIGIAENARAANFQVFPNPATTTLTLVADMQAGQQSPFEIYDAQARRVMNGTITSGYSTIDVSSFDAGVYVARIGNATQRFVVAR